MGIKWNNIKMDNLEIFPGFWYTNNLIFWPFSIESKFYNPELLFYDIRYICPSLSSFDRFIISSTYVKIYENVRNPPINYNKENIKSQWA